MTKNQIVRKLDQLKARQAKLRDEMRELETEITQHCENADEAVDALESASDAVSRLV